MSSSSGQSNGDGLKATSGLHEDAIAMAAMRAADKFVPPGKSIQDVISDPGALSALSQKLASVINDAMPDIPPAARKRVNALKNIQKATTKLEADFYKEVQLLEAKYHKLYQPHYVKRAEIVCGTYQPNQDECKWSDECSKCPGDCSDDCAQPQENGDSTSEDPKDDESSEEGIPEFWYTAFKNCELFSEFMRECDEEVLKHLVDVRVQYTSKEGLDFSIEYVFSPNEWFTNEVLTMNYLVKCEVDDADPWAFEGATIYACKGCTINWNKGRDLTTKTVKKKGKGKGKGQAKVTTKQVPNETFFSMFSLNHNSKDTSLEDDEELAATVMANFNLAEFIRDRLVPRAVLFYTGEAVEEESDEEDASLEGDFEDEEDDEDYDPEKDVNAVKPDCKQQ